MGEEDYEGASSEHAFSGSPEGKPLLGLLSIGGDTIMKRSYTCVICPNSCFLDVEIKAVYGFGYKLIAP